MFVTQQGICKAQSVNFVKKKKKPTEEQINYIMGLRVMNCTSEPSCWTLMLLSQAQSYIKPCLVWLKQPCKPRTPLGSLRSKVGGNNSPLKHLGWIPRFLTHSELSPYSCCRQWQLYLSLQDQCPDFDCSRGHCLQQEIGSESNSFT